MCQYTTVLKEKPPGFTDNRYEVNYMNLEKGTPPPSEQTAAAAAAAVPRTRSNPQICDSKKPDKYSQKPNQSLFDSSKNVGGGGVRFDEEARRRGARHHQEQQELASSRADRSSSERLIEYCEEEEEEEDPNMAVSGKLAIHLDTGETSREFCVNRLDDTSRRSQTKDDSVTCTSDDKVLFVKKYQGRRFQAEEDEEVEEEDEDEAEEEEEAESESPPVPPPRSKSKEASPKTNNNNNNNHHLNNSARNEKSPGEKSVYFDAIEGGGGGSGSAGAGGGEAHVIDPAAYLSSTKAGENRLPGSLGESKNVEHLEKKEVKSVESSDRSVSQSRSSSSDKKTGGGGGRAGVAANRPQSCRRTGQSHHHHHHHADEYSAAIKGDKPARRISLDDLSSAFQGLNGSTSNNNTATSKNKSNHSTKQRTELSAASKADDCQSDDSLLEDRGLMSSRSGSHHRRSKSEESLLDRADTGYVLRVGGAAAGGLANVAASAAVGRSRNSPLSHSSSMHQHLGGSGGAGLAYDRSSSRGQKREPSFCKEDSPLHVVKSRIPVPVAAKSSDKEDKSLTAAAESEDVYSSEANLRSATDYHPGSYVSRYADPHRYTSSYVTSSYSPVVAPSHTYNLHDRASVTGAAGDYTLSTNPTIYSSSGYKPSSSAKDYTRYNYYSSAGSAAGVAEQEPSYLTGGGGLSTAQTSPRWRRRSYDHDSDYLRYQRRSRPLSDYPSLASANQAAAAASSALTRSRSRSRVSDYDPYRRETVGGGGDTGGGGGGFLSSGGSSAYSSRPASSYLYSHSYYHEAGDDRLRQPRPPDYPPISAEVSGRTRRYQPADK